MLRLNGRGATIIAALAAGLVFANSLLNGWAGDDPLLIRDNLRAHSIGAALDAWFLPYWPPPWQGAGTYRPLTILSYGIEWSLGGGRLWVFHLTNLLLHALTTGLVVRVALAWLAPAGALAAGLLFAVHPVHVEAVSNVVGRAELLAAAGILAAVLAARRYRHAADDLRANAWLAGTLVIVALALSSKEHSVIATAVIAIDHFLDPEPGRRRPLALYVGLLAVTLTWLHIWKSIAGLYVAGGATTAFYGMSAWERWATMLPAQLDVLRLLVWPLDLSSDYSQQTITLRTTWTALATLGLVSMAAAIALGLLLTRRAPAVAFGILVAAGSYAPTSNFLFTSGVVLAERALYIAVLAPALALGWIVVHARHREHYRMLTVAVGLVLVVFAVRSWTRTPFWRTSQGMIVENAGDHLENYRARLHLGDLVAARRDTARALAEYLSADALAERDPFLALFVVNASVALKRYDLAIQHARRALDLAPLDSRPARWLVQTMLLAGKRDSAVATALEQLRANPGSAGHAENYRDALDYAGAQRSRQLIARASADWLAAHLVQASARLDSLDSELARPGNSPVSCGDREVGVSVFRALKPELLTKSAEGC